MAKLPKRINTSENNLKELVKEAVASKNYTEIEIVLIKAPKYHDRKYIDPTTIYELSQSIESTKGLIYPIVVRELKDGTLERIIGYRRIEAYKLLKKKTIPTIILKNISDKQALLLMTTENLQRENLSPYDETLALIDYLAVSLDVDPEEVLKLLYRFKNYKNGNLVNTLKESEKKEYFKVEEILEKTGKISISTLINRIGKTNVHPLLKEVLSKGEITFAVASVLNKIKDEKLLKKAIDESIQQGFSKREAQKYLKDTFPQKEKNQYANKLKRIAKIKIDSLGEVEQKRIDELLAEIFKIAESSS